MVFIELVLNLILFFLDYKLKGVKFGGEKIQLSDRYSSYDDQSQSFHSLFKGTLRDEHVSMSKRP